MAITFFNNQQLLNTMARRLADCVAPIQHRMSADAQCYECGKQSGRKLCETCVSKLIVEHTPASTRAAVATSLYPLLADGVISTDLARRHLDEVYALTPYSCIDAWINRVKRHSDRSAMGALCHLFEIGANRWLTRRLPQANCLIVPIPCSIASLSQRGFSIADKFAMLFYRQARRCGMAERYRMDRHILQLRPEYWYPNEAQKTKDRKTRLQADSPFLLAKNGAHRHKQFAPLHRILLIDDIATTGQTLGQAGELLQTAYPELTISALVLAFTEPKGTCIGPR